MDPHPFQVEIPTHEDLLSSCKICSVFDNYVEIGGVDFDFASLMPFGSKCPDVNVLLMGGQPERLEKNASQGSEKLNPILASLREVAKDIVVEGFFREHGDEKVGRVE
eukprot:scaffold5776_cov113-Chaetoceros_neogracile.AAC.1